jgi:hypothetical protein
MNTTTLTSIAMILSLTAAGAAFAGPPTAQHPCYGIADCKTQQSQKEFSTCIKENEAEANANAECAAFRADKDVWMKQNGIANLEDLFES